MLAVLVSLLGSKLAGIRQWLYANALAVATFLMIPYGDQIDEPFYFEVARMLYAAAAVATLIGYRRLFNQPDNIRAPLLGLVLLQVAILLAQFTPEALRLCIIAGSLFQAWIALLIWQTVSRVQPRKMQFNGYGLAKGAAALLIVGHLLRVAIQLFGLLTDLPPLGQGWASLPLLMAGTLLLPALTLIGLIIAYESRMERSEDAAKLDYLTGVRTLRALVESVQHHLALGKRSGAPLALLMLDVDNFKSINDLYGHAAGDIVLKDLAFHCKETIREIDCVARIGGDEFALLLVNTDLADATQVAERLHANLKQTTGNRDPATAGYTISIGVACCAAEGNLSELMRLADHALYRAKRAGRNRIALMLGALSDGSDAGPAALSVPSDR